MPEKERDKLSQEEALDLIGTMYRMGQFPETEQDLATFAETLMEAACERRTLARDIVARLRRTCTFFPADAQFFEAANELNPVPPAPGWQPKMHYSCKECQDTGWAPVERNGLSGVNRCSCAEGAKRGKSAATPVPDQQRSSSGPVRAGDFLKRAAGDDE